MLAVARGREREKESGKTGVFSRGQIRSDLHFYKRNLVVGQQQGFFKLQCAYRMPGDLVKLQVT